MNLIHQNKRLFGLWKPATFVGCLLNGLGLTTLALLVHQIMPPLLQEAAQSVSIGVLGAELALGVLLIAIGFSLMVIGADPFDEPTQPE